MKRLIPLVALFFVVACGGDDGPTAPTIPPTTTAPYSQTDLVVGTGAVAQSGSQINVAYTGWLHDSSKAEAKGTQFQTNPSFGFRLGTGQVIAGWDQGVVGMRVGGVRRLVLPPNLAYGNNPPAGSGIPTNATLIFDVTLNSVQ